MKCRNRLQSNHRAATISIAAAPLVTIDVELAEINLKAISTPPLSKVAENDRNRHCTT